MVEKMPESEAGAKVLMISSPKQTRLSPSSRLGAFSTPLVMLLMSRPTKLLVVPVLPPTLMKLVKVSGM